VAAGQKAPAKKVSTQAATKKPAPAVAKTASKTGGKPPTQTVAKAKTTTPAKPAVKAVSKTSGKKAEGAGGPKVAAKAKSTKPVPTKAVAKVEAAPKKGGSSTKKPGSSVAKTGESKSVTKPVAKVKPAVAEKKPSEERSDRTPAPPAKIAREEEAGSASVSRVSENPPKPSIGETEGQAAMKRATAEPPFSAEDDESAEGTETVVEQGVAPVGGEEGVSQEAAENHESGSEPVISVAQQVAQAETPMVLVLGMAGGAGAAAWNAELPESNSRGGVPEHPLNAVAPTSAPATGPSKEVSGTVPVVPVATEPNDPTTPGAVIPEEPAEPLIAAALAPVGLPTLEVMASAVAEPSPPADPPTVESAPVQVEAPAAVSPSPDSGLVIEAVPSGEVLVEPEGAGAAAVAEALATPDGTDGTDGTDGSDGLGERESVAAAAVAAPASDLAELAGLADSLTSLPEPGARVVEAGAAALEKVTDSGKAKASITALAAKALPALPEGDARVVATALMRALPEDVLEKKADSPESSASEEEEGLATEGANVDLGQDIERAPEPERLQQPSAPDELAPKRADRTGSAFEVPAAAGDLLIAANSQTDFQMDEKRVVFTGKVIMKNERFFLTADKLVAYMKENQSGLEFAEAQGNVIVRMVENGRETGSSGMSKTAVFHPDTGEIVLKGWPQLRLGNKAHVASSATTEMSLFTDGRMKTSGRNQTMIVP
jgi:lipopolysaccharide transport protein LptA